MTEKLIPFDIVEATKDPMRIRHSTGLKPLEARFFHGSLVVLWAGNTLPGMYWPSEMSDLLRLADKTRTVRCRPYRDGRYIGFSSSDVNYDIDGDTAGYVWAGPSFEVEITE